MQHSSRYSSPHPEASAFRALAVAHLVIAGISLILMTLQSGVDSSQADRQVEQALKVVDTAETQAMRQTLRRTIDIKDGLRDHLTRKLPLTLYYGQVNQVVDLVTSLLLIAAGFALYRHQASAQPLSLAYASLSLLQKLFNLVYLGLCEVPIAREYLETVQRLHPQDAKLIQGILDPITSGPLYQVVFAAYPILVAVIMLRPQAIQQLQPTEPEELPPPPPSGAVGLPSAAFPDDDGGGALAELPRSSPERW